MRNKIKENSGITLIALIVTIVVLIILATISVNLLMNGNIIGRAEQSKEIQAKAAELERLELIKAVVALDNKGKVTVDDYIKEAIKEGVTTEDEIEDNEDESKNIITDNGWNVNIAPDPDNENNVIITIEGKGTELAPRITKIDTSATKNSITVNIKVRYLNGGKVEYYYRLHGKTPEDSYKKIEGGTNEEVTITGIAEGESCDIKVVATNINGTDEKEVTDVKVFVSISKITLNAMATRMAAGYTKTLLATIEPENATNKELKWSTTDTNIATVEDGGIGAFGTEGNVKSASEKSGKVTITAKAKDGSDVTASCEVEVVVANEIKTIVGDTTSSNTNRTMCDEYGNLITIPADFTVVANGNFGVEYKYTGNTSSPSIQDGIVIKDKDDNQFTWIPAELVQNKSGDKNGPSKNIILGRYTFDIGSYDSTTKTYTGMGKEELQQDASDYASPKIITSWFQELAVFREGVPGYNSTAKNSTARNLMEFVTKTKANSGYYIGRYEASYRSGTTKTNYIPYCKESRVVTEDRWSNTQGRLWNWISQENAAAACRNMYGDGYNYASDLVNSYAWDSAIVFIQTYSDDEKYSRNTSVNMDTPLNTGRTGDKVCNIYDMSSNLIEFSTEYSSRVIPYGDSTSTVMSAQPYTVRGGGVDTAGYATSIRSYINQQVGIKNLGFRPILYMKTAS